jgi:hypothetical protein
MGGSLRTQITWEQTGLPECTHFSWQLVRGAACPLPKGPFLPNLLHQSRCALSRNHRAQKRNERAELHILK